MKYILLLQLIVSTFCATSFANTYINLISDRFKANGGRIVRPDFLNIKSDDNSVTVYVKYKYELHAYLLKDGEMVNSGSVDVSRVQSNYLKFSVQLPEQGIYNLVLAPKKKNNEISADVIYKIVYFKTNVRPTEGDSKYSTHPFYPNNSDVSKYNVNIRRFKLAEDNGVLYALIDVSGKNIFSVYVRTNSNDDLIALSTKYTYTRPDNKKGSAFKDIIKIPWNATQLYLSLRPGDIYTQNSFTFMGIYLNDLK